MSGYTFVFISLSFLYVMGCQDGSYRHEGKTCCRCAAGQHLEKHCSVKPEDRTCLHCEAGTYNSDPNARDSCEPCTSCDDKANMEEEDKCTIAVNTVCRCQQNHYCDKGKEHCTACYQCETCPYGEKVACTATNDTICLDPKEQREHTGSPQGPNVEAANNVQNQAQEMQPLHGVDLSPLLTDIAAELGWKVMEKLALKSGMNKTIIEAQQINSPGDAEEQCFKLLTAWVEREGSKASGTLVQTLHNMGKKEQAEKVLAIINRQHTVTSCSSG